MKYHLAMILGLGLSGVAGADEVKLRNGGVLRGSTREESGNIVIDTGMGTITVPADQVESILPDKLDPCNEPSAISENSPQTALPAAKPVEPKKARVLGKDPQKAVKVRRVHPEPEISPGYQYLGIPPSIPPRGSQNHGGYGGNALIAIPTTVRGVFMTTP